MINLVILGQSGMIGKAIALRAARRPNIRLVNSPKIEWAHPEFALWTLQQHMKSVIDDSTANEDSWCVIWAAGSAVPASNREETESELGFFSSLIELLRELSVDSKGYGAFVYLSSAGGVYAGSGKPPYDESTPLRAISAYGELKVTAESLAQSLSTHHLKVGIARLSNVYGPGQKINKPQGLISLLTKATILRDEVNIYVPFDTSRDYLYVDDCAELILNFAEFVVFSKAGGTQIKNIFSGQVFSVGEIISEVQRVTGLRPLVSLSANSNSVKQPNSIRLTSTAIPEIVLKHPTPLALGIKRTQLELLLMHQDGILR